MQYTTLGGTGLKVSIAGFGGGGGSRMGLADGKSAREASNIVRTALDQGITVFDTASSYGSEEAMGLGLKGVDRASVVVSTKHFIAARGSDYTTEEIISGLDNSLKIMGLDYFDIFFIHGLRATQLPRAIDDVFPALKLEQEKGKFRFLGATEAPVSDPRHDMVRQVTEQDLVDVVMVAFSVLNQNARQIAFPGTQAKGIGTYMMFVVRNMFAYHGHTWDTFRRLADEGKLPAEFAADENALDFLIRPDSARDLLDVAYRYVRDEPGVDVTLFGTGKEEHLIHNVESLLGPPLLAADREKLDALFGHLEGVGLESPRPRN
ncbi:MAG: aldo/keto reductase [Proteobacteria bacterium]|nr:aldo/keto reductase [Pseudomonadota bacterium]